MGIEEGYCKGETCNRDGCQGVIIENDEGGSCSCHINPPCDHCTTPREYCPECGWDALEEQRELDAAAYKAAEKSRESAKEALAAPPSPEDGEIWFQVNYRGGILPMMVIEEFNDGRKKFRYSDKSIAIVDELSHSFVEDWEFKPGMFTSTFNPHESTDMFQDVEIAKAKSLELFEKNVNPNGIYRVAKYFDDVFDGYVTEPMSKAEALNALKPYAERGRNSIYSRFRLVLDGNQY